jgi:hypothetical protein
MTVSRSTAKANPEKVIKIESSMQENLQPVVIRMGFEPAHLGSTLMCAKHYAIKAAVKQKFPEHKFSIKITVNTRLT